MQLGIEDEELHDTPIGPSDHPAQEVLDDLDRGLIRTGLIVASLVIPALIQLFGGFTDPAQLESWGVFALFDETGPLYFLGRDSPIGSQAMRPLTVFPHAVAYSIDPDSFFGFHLVQAAGIALQSFGMYGLCRQLRLDRQVSLVTSTVFALFPAWTGIFAFRTAHFHFAVGLIAVSGILLLRSRESNRWLELGAMSVLSCVALMFYEGFYLVVSLVPLLLLVENKLPYRRFALLACLWFVGPAINALHILWVLRTGPPQYQEVAGTSAPRSASEVSSLFGRSWYGSFEGLVSPPFGFQLTILGAIACLLLAGVLIYLVPLSPGAVRPRRALLGAAIGIGLAPATALVYWNNPAWLADPLRIYSVVSIVMALAIGLIVSSIHSNPLRTAASVVLVVSVVLSAVGQRDYWHRVSEFQEHVAGEILIEMASHGNSTVIALYDPAYQIGDVYSFLEPHLEIALSYLREDPTIRVSVCNTSVEEARLLNSDSACALTPTNVVLADGEVEPISSTLVLELSDGVIDTVTGPPIRQATLGDRALDALDCVDTVSCEPIPPSADPLPLPLPP